MKIDEFFRTYVEPFETCDYHWEQDKGFIVWRLGTGLNIELLHIRAFAVRKGYGRYLVYRMLEALQRSPPYYSIFGFTRLSNTRAASFYSSLGFNLQHIQGLYRDGATVMFWQSYDELMKQKEIYEDSIRGKALPVFIE